MLQSDFSSFKNEDISKDPLCDVDHIESQTKQGRINKY